MKNRTIKWPDENRPDIEFSSIASAIIFDDTLPSDSISALNPISFPTDAAGLIDKRQVSNIVDQLKQVSFSIAHNVDIHGQVGGIRVPSDTVSGSNGITNVEDPSFTPPETPELQRRPGTHPLIHIGANNASITHSQLLSGVWEANEVISSDISSQGSLVTGPIRTNSGINILHQGPSKALETLDPNVHSHIPSRRSIKRSYGSKNQDNSMHSQEPWITTHYSLSSTEPRTEKGQESVIGELLRGGFVDNPSDSGFERLSTTRESPLCSHPTVEDNALESQDSKAGTLPEARLSGKVLRESTDAGANRTITAVASGAKKGALDQGRRKKPSRAAKLRAKKLISGSFDSPESQLPFMNGDNEKNFSVPANLLTLKPTEEQILTQEIDTHIRVLDEGSLQDSSTEGTVHDTATISANTVTEELIGTQSYGSNDGPIDARGTNENEIHSPNIKSMQWNRFASPVSVKNAESSAMSLGVSPLSDHDMDLSESPFAMRDASYFYNTTTPFFFSELRDNSGSFYTSASNHSSSSVAEDSDMEVYSQGESDNQDSPTMSIPPPLLTMPNSMATKNTFVACASIIGNETIQEGETNSFKEPDNNVLALMTDTTATTSSDHVSFGVDIPNGSVDNTHDAAETTIGKTSERMDNPQSRHNVAMELARDRAAYLFEPDIGTECQPIDTPSGADIQPIAPRRIGRPRKSQSKPTADEAAALAESQSAAKQVGKAKKSTKTASSGSKIRKQTDKHNEMAGSGNSAMETSQSSEVATSNPEHTELNKEKSDLIEVSTAESNEVVLKEQDQTGQYSGNKDPDTRYAAENFRGTGIDDADASETTATDPNGSSLHTMGPSEPNLPSDVALELDASPIPVFDLPDSLGHKLAATNTVGRDEDLDSERIRSRGIFEIDEFASDAKMDMDVATCEEGDAISPIETLPATKLAMDSPEMSPPEMNTYFPSEGSRQPPISTHVSNYEFELDISTRLKRLSQMLVAKLDVPEPSNLFSSCQIVSHAKASDAYTPQRHEMSVSTYSPINETSRSGNACAIPSNRAIQSPSVLSSHVHSRESTEVRIQTATSAVQTSPREPRQPLGAQSSRVQDTCVSKSIALGGPHALHCVSTPAHQTAESSTQAEVGNFSRGEQAVADTFSRGEQAVVHTFSQAAQATVDIFTTGVQVSPEFTRTHIFSLFPKEFYMSNLQENALTSKHRNRLDRLLLSHVQPQSHEMQSSLLMLHDDYNPTSPTAANVTIESLSSDDSERTIRSHASTKGPVALERQSIARNLNRKVATDEQSTDHEERSDNEVEAVGANAVMEASVVCDEDISSGADRSREKGEDDRDIDSHEIPMGNTNFRSLNREPSAVDDQSLSCSTVALEQAQAMPSLVQSRSLSSPEPAPDHAHSQKEPCIDVSTIRDKASSPDQVVDSHSPLPERSSRPFFPSNSTKDSPMLAPIPTDGSMKGSITQENTTTTESSRPFDSIQSIRNRNPFLANDDSKQQHPNPHANHNIPQATDPLYNPHYRTTGIPPYPPMDPMHGFPIGSNPYLPLNYPPYPHFPSSVVHPIVPNTFNPYLLPRNEYYPTSSMYAPPPPPYAGGVPPPPYFSGSYPPTFPLDYRRAAQYEGFDEEPDDLRDYPPWHSRAKINLSRRTRNSYFHQKAYRGTRELLRSQHRDSYNGAGYDYTDSDSSPATRSSLSSGNASSDSDAPLMHRKLYRSGYERFPNQSRYTKKRKDEKCSKGGTAHKSEKDSGRKRLLPLSQQKIPTAQRNEHKIDDSSHRESDGQESSAVIPSRNHGKETGGNPVKSSATSSEESERSTAEFSVTLENHNNDTYQTSNSLVIARESETIRSPIHTTAKMTINPRRAALLERIHKLCQSTDAEVSTALDGSDIPLPTPLRRSSLLEFTLPESSSSSNASSSLRSSSSTYPRPSGFENDATSKDWLSQKKTDRQLGTREIYQVSLSGSDSDSSNASTTQYVLYPEADNEDALRFHTGDRDSKICNNRHSVPEHDDQSDMSSRRDLFAGVLIPLSLSGHGLFDKTESVEDSNVNDGIGNVEASNDQPITPDSGAGETLVFALPEKAPPKDKRPTTVHVSEGQSDHPVASPAHTGDDHYLGGDDIFGGCDNKAPNTNSPLPGSMADTEFAQVESTQSSPRQKRDLRGRAIRNDAITALHSETVDLEVGQISQLRTPSPPRKRLRERTRLMARAAADANKNKKNHKAKRGNHQKERDLSAPVQQKDDKRHRIVALAMALLRTVDDDVDWNNDFSTKMTPPGNDFMDFSKGERQSVIPFSKEEDGITTDNYSTKDMLGRARMQQRSDISPVPQQPATSKEVATPDFSLPPYRTSGYYYSKTPKLPLLEFVRIGVRKGSAKDAQADLSSKTLSASPWTKPQANAGEHARTPNNCILDAASAIDSCEFVELEAEGEGNTGRRITEYPACDIDRPITPKTKKISRLNAADVALLHVLALKEFGPIEEKQMLPGVFSPDIRNTSGDGSFTAPDLVRLPDPWNKAILEYLQEARRASPSSKMEDWEKSFPPCIFRTAADAAATGYVNQCVTKRQCVHGIENLSLQNEGGLVEEDMLESGDRMNTDHASFRLRSDPLHPINMIRLPIRNKHVYCPLPVVVVSIPNSGSRVYGGISSTFELMTYPHPLSTAPAHSAERFYRLLQGKDCNSLPSAISGASEMLHLSGPTSVDPTDAMALPNTPKSNDKFGDKASEMEAYRDQATHSTRPASLPAALAISSSRNNFDAQACKERAVHIQGSGVLRVNPSELATGNPTTLRRYLPLSNTPERRKLEFTSPLTDRDVGSKQNESNSGAEAKSRPKMNTESLATQGQASMMGNTPIVTTTEALHLHKTYNSQRTSTPRKFGIQLEGNVPSSRAVAHKLIGSDRVSTGKGSPVLAKILRKESATTAL